MPLVAKAETAEAKLPGADGRLSRAVAQVAAKLMTYKDEYEVGRLFTDPSFRARLAENFEGDFELRYNLAPPLFSRRDKATGRPRKAAFWRLDGHVLQALMSRMRILRGNPARHLWLRRPSPHGAPPDPRLCSPDR